MSAEMQPFTLDDVELAYFAYVTQQEADAELESSTDCLGIAH